MKNEGTIPKTLVILGAFFIAIVLILFIFTSFDLRIFLNATGENAPTSNYMVIPLFLFGQIRAFINDLLVGLALISGAQIVILLSRKCGSKK
jgi:hypothetical protein